MSKKLEIQATGTRLIVRVESGESLSSSGIKIPEKNQKPDRGEIVSMGFEVMDPAIQLGKIAVFNEYAGKSYEENGEKYILLNTNEIYGTI